MGDVTAGKLKACPFCGSMPKITTNEIYASENCPIDPDEFWIDCVCGISSKFLESEELLIEHWNRRAPQLSAEQGEKVSYETLESAFNDRVRVIEMQLRDKEILESELSRLREQLSQTTGLSIRDSVLCWLGIHRDKLPPEAVSKIQDLLGVP